MSCPYYTWRSDYYCTKKPGYVNEDIYYKHCRNYDYDYCPIYKGQDPGGCYLTSACTEAKGLPDDCRELTTLRKFRDEWLKDQPGGAEEVETYYKVAPGIVAAIQARPDSKAIFETIYEELVSPCVALIEEGKMEETWKLYREMTRKLEVEQNL